MVDLIRTSHASLVAIPAEHKYLLHSMSEDNDLEGAEEAENIIAFLEEQTPGMYVGILANDSVSPGCDGWKREHYHCERYARMWYTFLISKAVWEQYKEAVEAKHKEYLYDHRCKVSEVSTEKEVKA
jgi:hypothetical protein